MIRVQEITIKEFRGIRDLTLKPQGKNFAICGPNGTGKSGIVDAVEFALTGNISRLSGEGTRDISVKEHGPHVDSRSNPEKASVTLTAFIPSINQIATIHRTVKGIKAPIITPNTPEVKAAFEQIGLHPEFVLSRREIIRYVLAEPGKRSKEVQALLRLDEIETLRAALQKISNACAKKRDPLEAAKNSTAESLSRGMEITKAGSKEILEAANKKRAVLSLPAISKLEATTSLKDGLTAVGATVQAKIQKATALADVRAANEQRIVFEADNFQAQLVMAEQSVRELTGAASEGADRESLLQTAMKLFDEEMCPVCDTEWTPSDFRKIVADKLKALEDVTKKRQEAAKQLSAISGTIEHFISTLKTVLTHAQSLSEPLDLSETKKFGRLAVEAVKQFRSGGSVEDTLKYLSEIKSVPADVGLELRKLSDAVEKIPEVSDQEAAQTYLIIAQERLDAYRQAALALKKGSDEATLAETVCAIYAKETTDALDEIYKQVEVSFTELYRHVNDDEAAFDAQLTPSSGKLGFDVDFYGRGFFPPGAYHSEGHQDGMGLCLYLALMKHLLGDGFAFCVLDDVLMSVDAGHRREVSKMLMEKFPDTQFIMTTHDDVWLRHMRSAGLVQADGFVNFRKWSVELGPTEWEDRDVWQEIDDYVSKNDIRAAASLLRHYLEHLGHEMCHSLRAQVEFRSDSQFTLGDLLPNAIKAFKKRIKEGKNSAQSWGHTDIMDELGEVDKKFTAAVAASKIDEWQVNAAVHYNAWASLGKKDFEPVVKAFKDLITCFKCSSCGGLLYVQPEKSTAEMVRCGCAKTSVNLVEKPKGTLRAPG